jgi:UDP-N-acetylmuramate--alanine ligase
LAGRHVHFIAIGGAGMSALAELLLLMGYEISGSDIADSGVVRHLAALGARVSVGSHTRDEVEGADHVVVSNAIRRHNPALERARQLGLDVLMRAELLGRVLDCGRGIAVAGTHGKTTTSAMLGFALSHSGLSPSLLIGGLPGGSESGASLGQGDLIVAEADEHFGTFLHLRPEIAVVTNVDADHLDFYGSQQGIDDAFVTFLCNRRPGGTAVLSADDAGARRIRERVSGPVVTFGFADADLDASPEPGGFVHFVWKGEQLGRIHLGQPGRHNVLNAAAAAAAALVVGARAGEVLDSLGSFRGVDRRFSVRGSAGSITVVDDYAHNPAKVRATLAAARGAYADSRIVAVFEPHRYTRTQLLAAELGRELAAADAVIVTDVYGSDEEPIEGVTGRLVWEAVRNAAPGIDLRYAPDLGEAAALAAAAARPGDVIITMGAGDVTTIAPRILELLAGRE